MNESLETIKVFFKHRPQNIISYIPECSKKETLDKIRPKINQMKENHLFVVGNGDTITIDLEGEIPLESILDENEGKNPKLFIFDPEYSKQENQAKSKQLIKTKENININKSENKGNENKKEINQLKEKIKILSSEVFYYSCIFENKNGHDLYKYFFQFYTELFKIGINLAKLSLNEIANDVVSLSNKIFNIGKNLDIIDNNQLNEYKYDLLLIKEFNFVIDLLESFGKISKTNYVNIFILFEKIFNDSQQYGLDKEDFVNLLNALKDIIGKYETNYIYIEIFLINFEIINKKTQILNYIFDKKNINLFEGMLPILNKIFSNDITEKLNFKDIQYNKYYFQFRTDVFYEINNNCIINEDSLGEMVFFYFENKIMNEFEKREKEDGNFIEKNIDNFRYYVEFLEKNHQEMIKENNFLSITFTIAFVKCYIYKVIKSIHENDGSIKDPDYLFYSVLRFKDNRSELSPYKTSIKLYFLKLLIYINGNYSDIRNLQLNKYCLEDLRNKLDTFKIEKEFGFDFMFIPVQLDTDNNAYNSIIEKFFNSQKLFDDKKLIDNINNNVDIFYCLFQISIFLIIITKLILLPKNI